MAKIQGAISITGLLAPNDSADTYAITDEKYGKGGYRSVANISERDAITSERRTEGMLVKVLADGKFYTLSGGISNSNWIEQVMGGSTGGGGEVVTGTSPISVINNVVSISEATISASGSMSAADKDKLNKIAAGAEVNVQSDWNQTVNTADDYIKNIPLAFPPSAHNQAESTITFTDITTGNASTSSHGYLKKLSNVSTEFLNGQGSWVTPASTKDTTAITGLLKGNGSTISAATAGTDYLLPTGSAAGLTSFPTLNQNTTGSAATLTTARTITIGSTGKTFNGSGNVTWTLGEIGAQAAGSYLTGNQTVTLSGAVTGSGATAITTSLATGIVGISNLSATGTANSTTYLRGDNTWQTVSTGGVTSIATDGTAITGGTITSTGTISHSTSDGYKHVPATGTTNSGKVLTAGATAGAMTWETPVVPDVKKELLISKSTFNSIAEPGIYKNSSVAKQITGYRIMSNATDFSITIGGVTYTKNSNYPLTLNADQELIITDVVIQSGYNMGNVILIIE